MYYQLISNYLCRDNLRLVIVPFAVRSLLKHPSTYLLNVVKRHQYGFLSIFWKLCNHRLKVDEDLVMFSLLPKLPVDKALQDVLFYLTCLARYSIWIVRCKVKKEFRSFSGNSSLEEFKKKLKFRILVDSQRYKNDRRIFLQSWAIDDVLCSIDAQGGLTYHF